MDQKFWVGGLVNEGGLNFEHANGFFGVLGCFPYLGWSKFVWSISCENLEFSFRPGLSIGYRLFCNQHTHSLTKTALDNLFQLQDLYIGIYLWNYILAISSLLNLQFKLGAQITLPNQHKKDYKVQDVLRAFVWDSFLTVQVLTSVDDDWKVGVGLDNIDNIFTAATGADIFGYDYHFKIGE